jgi:putative SOS response-associated peptidase YedK
MVRLGDQVTRICGKAVQLWFRRELGGPHHTHYIGLVWQRDGSVEFKLTTFNARSEEAAGKPVFKDAYAKRRCLIPAIGWYEWSGAKGAKTPWFITIKRNTPGFWFAGLWSETRFGEDRVRSCTILTAAAGEATRHLHPRTPVVLSEEQATAWLAMETDPANLMKAPPDDRVDLWQVTPAVGKVRENGPDLISPVTSA